MRTHFWTGIGTVGWLWAMLLWAGCLISSPTSVIPDSYEPRTDTLDAGGPAPSLILMIGDGMGIAQVTAAMYSNKSSLNLEQFPVVGFHKTASAADLITDSAAGATAIACGQKTWNSFIGMTTDTLPCTTILEEARAAGMATGLIATSSIVHATPASFAAHEPMRISYEAIAADMAESGVDLLIGGGLRYFSRRESDDRDLVAELQSRGYRVADYLTSELGNLRPQPERPFAYFTADNHPLPVNQGRSYLSYASRLGASFLDRRSDKGFVLVIEGSQIDWANHAKEGKLAIEETLDFDRAVGEVLDFARQRGNTLVIVTADHESGGMAVTGDKIGKVKTDFTTNGHTATMVPVYSYGPGAGMFSGVYENTALYSKFKSYLRLGTFSLTGQ